MHKRIMEHKVRWSILAVCIVLAVWIIVGFFVQRGDREKKQQLMDKLVGKYVNSETANYVELQQISPDPNDRIYSYKVKLPEGEGTIMAEHWDLHSDIVSIPTRVTVQKYGVNATGNR